MRIMLPGTFLQSVGTLKPIRLADWQISGIWAYQTGAHWSPFDGRPADIIELEDGACAPNAEDFVTHPQNCINKGR
jgi:hypothetical protein